MVAPSDPSPRRRLITGWIRRAVLKILALEENSSFTVPRSIFEIAGKLAMLLKYNNICDLGWSLTLPGKACYNQIAGWSSPVARWAHNPKVAGSNPAPATK